MGRTMSSGRDSGQRVRWSGHRHLRKRAPWSHSGSAAALGLDSRFEDADTIRAVADDGELSRLRREQALYRRCLGLFRTDEPSPLITEALSLLRELARAECGYIELEDATTGRQQQWSAAEGLDDEALEQVRLRISRGIIAEAIETGEMVHVPSAVFDERFRERGSVREQGIEAVLCIPLMAEGIAGVIYLQNRVGGGPFSEDDVACAEAVAGFVASVGRMLLELLRRRAGTDATAGVRAQLDADEVLGASPALARLLERLAKVASLETNVLITGPIGSGKTLLARVLHNNSARKTGPFVEINTATIQESMVEAELFGALPGSFTGAPAKGLPGKVQAAEGGTLFLDEIGDLRPDLQAKLLQLTQAKQFYPVGSHVARTADVRVVSATYHDVPRMVKEGRFREDLYYRLRGVELKLPSLDERRGDIPQLATRFCEKFCNENRVPPRGFTRAALTELECAQWPGNIRQLENRCREAVVSALVEGATTIELRHLFSEEEREEHEGKTFRESRSHWESSFLAAELRQRGWNVKQTADDLEMSRSHLNTLIKRYRLTREGS